MAGKTLLENQLLAERGVALINEIVLAMGYAFRPTSVLDSGIDGEIELRDIQTGRMTNQIIKVQSKATAQFQNETDTGFSFWPNADDVKYWLGGNVPVILVLSCPGKREAYWVSVQEYRQANPTTKGIHFDKAKHRLDSSARSALASACSEFPLWPLRRAAAARRNASVEFTPCGEDRRTNPYRRDRIPRTPQPH